MRGDSAKQAGRRRRRRSRRQIRAEAFTDAARFLVNHRATIVEFCRGESANPRGAAIDVAATLLRLLAMEP